MNVAERSDRGPVVGVHLVGRRPRMDLSVYGISNGVVAGDLEVVYEGAANALRRLTHSSITSPGYSRSRPNIFPPTATPTLVALTNNETLFSVFTSSQSSLSEYNIVRTSPPPFDELRQFNEILRLEVTPDLQPPKGNANKLLREWDQQIWNDDVPRELKVLLTRYFVRDLIVMAQHADAFVVSGASALHLYSRVSSSESRSRCLGYLTGLIFWRWLASCAPYRRFSNRSTGDPPLGRRRRDRPSRPQWRIFRRTSPERGRVVESDGTRR